MLDVQVQHSATIAVLRVSGSMVFGSELSTLFCAVTREEKKRVVILDLTKVSRIDARGLGTLVLLKQWSHAVGIKLHVLASTPVQELIDVTGLHRLFGSLPAGAREAAAVIGGNDADAGVMHLAAD